MFEHINDTAKDMVGLLYRRFCKDISPQSLFQMYLALVRPHIPHNVFVPWTTALRSSSKLLYHQKMGRKEKCKGMKWREESKKGKMDSSLDDGG